MGARKNKAPAAPGPEWTGPQPFPGSLMNTTSLWTAIEWMATASLDEGAVELFSARLSELCSQGFEITETGVGRDGKFRFKCEWAFRLA